MSKTETTTNLTYGDLKNKSKEWLIWTLIAVAEINENLQKQLDERTKQTRNEEPKPTEEDDTPADASDCICKGPRSNPANCPKCCREDEE